MKTTLIIVAAAALAFAAGRSSVPDAITNDAPRATGIGGIFFKCQDPAAQKAWYAKHLGMPMNEYGSLFEFRDSDDNSLSYLQWSPFGLKNSYFAPSIKDFMINYRVHHIEALVERMRKDGVTFTDSLERFEYGAFIHAMDPEGNKIELWEPVDSVFTRLYEGTTVK